MKCLLIIIFLVGVFAAGFAAGEDEGRDRHEGYGKNFGDRGEHMMMQYQYGNEGGDQAEGGWDDSYDGSQNVQMMYRTVSQPATQMSAVTATPQK